MYPYKKLRRARAGFYVFVIASIILSNFSGGAVYTARAAEAANLDQARNGTANSPVSPISWVNGNLGSSNSHYVEGQSVPYRVKLTGLTPSTSYSIGIGFDIMQNGKHALDFLTNNNRIAETVDPCTGVSPCVAGAGFDIPTPPVSTPNTKTHFETLETAEGNQQFSVYNGTITAASYTAAGNESSGSSSEATMSITFTASNATVVLSWGGHIAREIDWGTGNSASQINGSPYHMKLKSFSAKNIGEQDRSLSAGAVTIVPVVCGDGTVGEGEQCDDSNTTDGDGCNKQCQLEFCGDETTQSGIGEQCDDGNVVSNDGCDNQCQDEVCGDGITQSGIGETCDDGDLNGQPNQCNLQCNGTTIPYCGNSVVESGESCDEGGLNGQPNQCSATCDGITPPYCGNSIIEAGEQCDTQVGVGEHQSCTQDTCQLQNLTYCGDTIKQSPNQESTGGPSNDGYEDCDTNDGVGDFQACTEQCVLINLEHCGDGVKNGQEECDGSDGVGANQSCSQDCTLINLPYCGDGSVNQQSEECDGQAGVGAHQQCTQSCTLENLTYCGDGIAQDPNDEGTGGPQDDGYEECDGEDGVGINQSCTSECVLEDLPYCGDGSVNQSFEQCDGQAGVGAHQQCNVETCQLEDLTYCGNGTKETPNQEGTGGPLNDGNEECDGEAGVGDNQSCSAQCTLVNLDFCGDGVKNGDEQCDGSDGVGQNQSCTTQCTLTTNPFCGDGSVNQEGEQCDDGNTANNDGCSNECTTETLQCTGSGTYTIDSQFDQGSLINVTHTPSDQLQLSDQVNAFNFIWVAVSTKGTVVKINTDTGDIVGEYKTSPSNQGNGDPSRTTVDKDGSVWLSNRSDVFNGNGSVIHVGLVENGQCEDRNGNGTIETSTAQNDIKPWADASGTRNVGTAEDECIVHYVELPNASGTRHISVNADNDVWVAGLYSRNFDLIQGGKWNVTNSGTIIRSESSVGYGGYGGLIDPNGVIWSARPLLRWDTANPLSGPNGTNWTGYTGFDSYGLCIDSTGNVWETALTGDQIRKYAPDGTILGTFSHGYYYAQGCAVDQNDHVWVAHSLLGGNTIGHILNDGTFIGNVTVGSGPTGISVDSSNKIWATNYYSGTVSRIDPTAGGLGADSVTPIGAVDLTTVYLGGNPYNYSDMTGSTLSGLAESGTWTVVHDGSVPGFAWKNIDWTASVPAGGSLTVTVATSSDGITFGAPQTVTDGQDLTSLNSRYLKVVVSFERGDDDVSPILYDLTLNRDCGGEPQGPVCGNGALESGEQCDDGNLNDTDSCNNSCTEQTPSGGGGGGGGGGGFQGLSVFNETNVSVGSPDTQISWFTNISATCTALYGDESQDNVGTPPNYDYDSTAAGATSNGTFHTATLTGIQVGTTYYWRPVCTSTSTSETKLGQQLTFALGPIVLGIEAPVPEENVKVLGFEVLPKTGGVDAEYYGIISSMFATVMSGLYVTYRRRSRRA